jgi:hypothetical protein
MSALDTLVETMTWLSWGLYTILVIIGLPGMYRSIEVFTEDDDIWLAFLAFISPLVFCAGIGVVVYYAPLISGALMAYFVVDTLKE